MARFLSLMVLANLLLLTVNTVSGQSLTLEQVDGTVYTDVTVKRSQPTALSFTHEGGFATIPAGSLTDESLSKLGLNPDDNPEFKNQREDMAMKENLRVLKKNHQTISGGLGTGQTIRTKDITDINPVTILVTENGVPRRVELSILPKDIQQELGYDSAKAAAYTKSKADAEMSASAGAAKVLADKNTADIEARKKREEADAKAAEAAAAAAAAAPTKVDTIHAIPPGK